MMIKVWNKKIVIMKVIHNNHKPVKIVFYLMMQLRILKHQKNNNLNRNCKMK